MSDNIKKSLLVTLDFPPNLGGVAAYYYNVCKNLPADKIVVLAPPQEGAQDFDSQQKFTIIRKNTLNNLPLSKPRGISNIFKIFTRFKWMTIIKDINETIKNHKIELLQIGQVLPLGTLAMVCQSSKKIPYIFYAHGLDITLPQTFKRKKILLKKIIKHAKAIVANSHWTKDELTNLGADPSKVTVVYPGPNLSAEQSSEWEIEEIKKEHDLKDKKVLLTVGRLVERKGHDMVIKALPKIIQAIPNVIYLIVGNGPRKAHLEKLVNQNSLRDYVEFISNVDQNSLAALYQICDVFIMPSRQLANGDVEGFGIVYLEANMFGKPVIAGQSGGVPEAVVHGQTGILVNPTDIEQITQAAVKLLNNQAYAAKLGTQGLERVSSQFDWPSQVDKIKPLLN